MNTSSSAAHFKLGAANWALLVLALLLSLSTMVSLKGCSRFYVEDEQLLQDSSFRLGNNNWQGIDSSTKIDVENQLTIVNHAGASKKVFQNIAIDKAGFYRFDFEAGVQEVFATGEEEWKSGNVAIIYYNHDGERVGSRMLATLRGSQPPMDFSEIILLRDVLGSVDVAFRLYNSGGEFTVINPKMSKLQEYPSYLIVKYVLSVLWLSLFVSVAIVMFRVMSVLQLLIVAGFAVLAIAGATMPEPIISNINQKIETYFPQEFLVGAQKMLNTVYGGALNNPGDHASKVGHFLVFLGIGIFVGSSLRRVSLIFASASITVFALTTEVLQMLVDGRTARIEDLFLDCLGGLIGLVFAATCVWCFHSIRAAGSGPHS